MQYDVKSKQIQASTQVTGHDLEYAINKLSSKKHSLPKVTTNLSDSVIILTQNYMNSHIQLTVKEKIYYPTVIGVEQNNDGNAYVYYTFDKIKKTNSFTIKNTMLTDHFPDQQNITHFNKGTTRKTRTFTSRLRKQTIDF